MKQTVKEPPNNRSVFSTFQFRAVVFLVLNFAALWIGVLLQGEGPQSEWYSNLNKAPWTPPGWVFGLAWGIIMICFSFYLTILFSRIPTLTLITIYGIQWILNVSWNLFFFNWHFIGVSLLIIFGLLFVITYFTFTYRKKVGMATAFIVPYFLWLIIASSLNSYIYLFN